MRIVGKRQPCPTAECKGTLIDRNRLRETTKTLYEGAVRARTAVEEQVRTAAVGRAEYTARANAGGCSAKVHNHRVIGVRIPVERCHCYVAGFGCAKAVGVAAGTKERRILIES